MSTIAENLAALQQAKADIAEAITTKGGTVGSGDGFSDFATDIGTIPTGGSPSLEDKTVPLDMASGNQVITATQGYDGLSRVTVTKPATLDPSNIKDGVNIGGVVGNYAPSSATLVTKTITQNGTYNASSDNADGYSQVTVNVSGGGATGDDVIFIDYDGTVLHSYSKAAFLALSAMPANPSHTGMVAQGWNYTLAQAQAYVTSYDKLIIGQLYDTESGKIEIDIYVYDAGTIICGGRNALVDWGDGTSDKVGYHNYQSAGKYTIKLGTTNFQAPSAVESVGTDIVRAVRWSTRVSMAFNVSFANCSCLEYFTGGEMFNNIAEQFRDTPIKCAIARYGTRTNSRAFYYCRKLEKISGFGSGVTQAGAFSNCTGLTGHLSFSSSYCVDSAFYNTGFSSVCVSDTSNHGSNIFNSCIKLESAEIRSGDVKTGHFTGCVSLKNVTLPNDCTNIGDFAFSDCYLLDEITIPNGVLSIGQNAFQNCSFSEVEIPQSVTSIGASAFVGCYLLRTVKLKSSTPPTLSDIYAFPTGVERIEIPSGSLSDYQNAENYDPYYSLFVEV